MKKNEGRPVPVPQDGQARLVGVNQSSIPVVGPSGPFFGKILVSDHIAGSIIGKGGTVINQIEKDFSCQLRLSSAGAYFPGTMQRICVIAGEQEKVYNALYSILLKIRDTLFPTKVVKENHFKQTSEVTHNENSNTMTNQAIFEPSNRFTLTMVIPLSIVSVIIGKKGENIKNIQLETNTKLLVSDNTFAHNERLISVTGNGDAVLAAASSIIRITQTDPNIKSAWNLDYRVNSPIDTHNENGHSKLRPQTSSQNHRLINPYSGINEPVLFHNCEIKFEIPDDAVGTIIGKQGLALSSISRLSGAKITISQKGDLVPGTNCRNVHLSGQLASIHQAHALLIQKYMDFTVSQENYNEPVPPQQQSRPMVARATYNNNPTYNSTTH